MILPRQVLASLQHCRNCGAWWVSQGNQPADLHLILRLAERFAEFFPWEKYGGWWKESEVAGQCPNCRQQQIVPIFSLFQHGLDSRNPVFFNANEHIDAPRDSSSLE